MPKPKIDAKLLESVARNSRISLTEGESRKFLKEMQEILDAFSKIDEVNVEKTRPSFQPVELKNVMRDDAAKKCLTQEEALSNTKHREKGYFRGPRVV
ncbi:MAG: Asp-tRNA(Asn)/Glu-tRNA(Gln) amidotransferase subunit GatC [Candidatus Diapherotrites archaeon]|nr:Asp-tRNA(Asn)/Glu-tRNA(Gln) amidotransferase subunit GatC [Candidatus Diapherotrites archaeon]